MNPKNAVYDRFYVANYVAQGNCSDDESIDDDDAEQWSDVESPCLCLLCDTICASAELLLTDHMPSSHAFYFDQTTCGLDFYGKVKLINFIRHAQGSGKCFVCLTDVCHANPHCHCAPKLPSHSQWKDSQFLFPTLEDDPLLQAIDDE